VGDAMWLTINAHIPYGENPAALLPDLRDALQAKVEALQSAAAAQPDELHPTAVSYPMEQERWVQIIRDATDRMRAGELKKVVLSRVAEVRFRERVLVDGALAFLAQRYPETYRFLFEPRPYHAFYGATPELLAHVAGDQVTTMALAGSIRRGATPEQDQQLAQELLHSPKDRYEHQLVIDGIRHRLEPLVQSLQIGTTDIMTLRNIQHIHTPIAGTLRQPDGILPVVAALHPTPALGGDPRELAMKLISQAEPVPRGWYAAPVGWIDRHLNGQFGVAIRSALAQERRVWLYAGAGIVRESDPLKEWDETALKFKPMLNALGLE
jgi:menaquinone-specific isochorismate synthase